MTVSSNLHDDGVGVVTVDYPPVNALPIAGWFAIANEVTALGQNADCRVVVLRSEGRGFNAGVDIKEIQAHEGHGALVDVNRACFASFKAIYECPVPVISAVHNFCLGGGVGLVGNSDVIVASDDAYFGVPEVDRGALGAATHLSRLVPQHMLRAFYFTGQNIPAARLAELGSVYAVVPRDTLEVEALSLARNIAQKDTRVIRAAKEALNGIDPIDVNSSYRFEQGFTYELTLIGVADELRDAFVGEKKSH